MKILSIRKGKVSLILNGEITEFITNPKINIKDLKKIINAVHENGRNEGIQDHKKQIRDVYLKICGHLGI